ncbi:NPP1 family protein [Pendulispora brunnea]|uniref:NPP1 family protein n=1 Tax=Pendulispora brunnea TaxID=2905690 RepID=A0ABZ2KDL0_9BACT
MSKMKTALRVLTGAGWMLLAGVALADPPQALDWNAPWSDRSYEPAFDYDGDGCYPTPAIGRDGTINRGLNPSGALNGQCHDMSDLDNTNGYSRSKCNHGWCAYMYGLYFEKDQAVAGSGIGGHRNDWEHVVVWVPDGDWPAYVSVSAHGNYTTYSRNDVPWDDSGTHPKVIYHKDGIRTHCFRIAGFGEQPENLKGSWQFPPLIGWDNYPPGFRDKLTQYDFGSAQFGLRDGSFNGELSKAKPANIPFDPNG